MNARNLMRWGASALLGTIGFPARHARGRRRRGRYGVILRYHRVIPREEPEACYRMGIGEDLFASQIAWLASARRVVSLEELLRRIASGEEASEDLVVLTFDDGYLDNRTHAAPILKRYDLPATFYVSSSCLTERMPFWPEVVAQMIRISNAPSLRLVEEEDSRQWPLATPEQRWLACSQLIARFRKRSMATIFDALQLLAIELGVSLDRARGAAPPVMDAADLQALVEDGFSIGSHTITHPYLSSEAPDRQREELEDSRRQLEEVLERPVLDFCYPGGGYDETTRHLVAEAGYRSATTSEFGVVGPGDDPLRLMRIGVGEALATGPGGRFSAAMMDAEVSGAMSALYRRRLRER
jgi:peptidoglycan/xylan/chitin deacetylase (PgdA/CDA1 family)